MRGPEEAHDTHVDMTGREAASILAITAFKRGNECCVDVFSLLNCDWFNAWALRRLLDLCHFPSVGKVFEMVFETDQYSGMCCSAAIKAFDSHRSRRTYRHPSRDPILTLPDARQACMNGLSWLR